VFSQLDWKNKVAAVVGVLGAAIPALFVLWVLLLEQDQYDLRWKLHPGEELRYRTVLRSGSQGSDEASQVILHRYTVGTVNEDGIADVTSLQERLTIHQGGPDGPVTWDSGSGKPAPKDYAIAASAAMTGVPIKYRVDKRGAIGSTDGLDAVKKRLREIVGGDVAADTSVSATGGAIIGAPLPTAPVTTGTRWTAESSMGGAGRSVLEYSLRVVQNGVATIVLIGSKSAEPAKAPEAKTAPPPATKHGSEDVSEFALGEGQLLSQVGRSWTQSTLPDGKPFRFEFRSETRLVERKSKE